MYHNILARLHVMYSMIKYKQLPKHLTVQSEHFPPLYEAHSIIS